MSNLTYHAQLKSLQHFMNSFVRDFHADRRVQFSQNILVETSEGQLLVEIEDKSLLGFHNYTGRIELNSKEISLKKLVSVIGKEFAEASSDISIFTNKFENSLTNMTSILEFNTKSSPHIRTYLDSEKRLLAGHPFHPYPKCKEGMNEDDIVKYSPEFIGEFSLLWIAVDPTLFYSNLNKVEYRQQIAELAKFDEIKVCENDLLLPMHPWQWERVLHKHNIDFSKIKVLGEGKNKFSALSSLRSVFNAEAPLLLKFSMGVCLTNSIRHLTIDESIRGKQVESVLKEEGVASRVENFDILFEPFFVSIKDMNGVPLEETIIQFRENFNENFSKEGNFLLSTLCEKNLLNEVSPIVSSIKKIAFVNNGNERLARKIFFSNFLTKAIKPYFDLYSEHGVLLGAHMQNVIIKMQDNIPVGTLYRDCQGTGFSLKGYQKYSGKYDFIKKSNGNILEDKDINKVFGYYLVVNSIFSTISAIAESRSEIEHELLNDFRSFLLSLKRGSNESAFVDYLLESDFLYQKGNMRCCLNNLNENTASDPWAIYNKIENPLRKLRVIESSRQGTLFSKKNKKDQLISFRVLEESDLELFYKWHHKEFVSEFWELNVSKSELLTYIRNLKASHYQLPLIFEVDNKPVGYFEAYWAYDDRIAPYCNPGVYDRGIHLLIGEEKYLRTRSVYDSMLFISEFLLNDNEMTQRVWGEPRADNKKILTFCSKLPGWKFLREFDFPHKRSALLECDKDRYFKEIENAL